MAYLRNYGLEIFSYFISDLYNDGSYNPWNYFKLCYQAY
jgi:hypothetical protein